MCRSIGAVRPEMERAGKSLERLIAMLESALASTGARIEAPCRRLIDRDTGKPREHDVVITWDHGHHQIITAVECRDRSKPVGVPDVEAFADKCETTGVHSSVIVSASGFRTSARTKAGARAITCMDIAEVESFDWLGLDAFVEFKRHFENVNIQIMFEDAMPAALTAVFNGDGQQLSEQDIRQIAINSVPHSADPELDVGREIPVYLRLMVDGWTAQGPDGRVWRIEHLLMESAYTTTRTTSPFTRHRYRGGGKDYAIASAEMVLGDQRGRIMMVRREDDTTEVIWTPDNHGLKPTNRRE